VVDNDEVLPDHTIIYGTGMRRTDGSGVDELKVKMVQQQVKVLKKLIPSNLVKWQ
jgi:dynactin-6